MLSNDSEGANLAFAPVSAARHAAVDAKAGEYEIRPYLTSSERAGSGAFCRSPRRYPTTLELAGYSPCSSGPGGGAKMVRAIVVTLLLASAAQGAEPVAKKETDIDAARFQLFQGTYSTFDLRRSETYSSTSVFLLDTRTGRVKRYVNKIDTDGRYIEEWVPTDRSQERR